MTIEILYEARNLSKSYGQVTALSDASLRIHAGEVVAVVGDNGAGKSTLVKVLSGAITPDSGELILGGGSVSWHSPHDALLAGVETLYQDAGLAPDLSIAANYFLGRELVRTGVLGRLGFLADRMMVKRANEGLREIGITAHDSRQVVNELSGGQRQAVAIGRAVAWANKVIILDEPTNHLGARQSRNVLEVIRRAREKGLGVLMISHALPQVLEVSDRVVVMRLGSIIEDAPTSGFSADRLVKAITGLVTDEKVAT